jgi:hypothetical protein
MVKADTLTNWVGNAQEVDSVGTIYGNINTSLLLSATVLNQDKI